jgi:hypothetical protein
MLNYQENGENKGSQKKKKKKNCKETSSVADFQVFSQVIFPSKSLFAFITN